MNSKRGKETKLPPPATAFRVPAIAAAKNRRMAWVKCKLLFIRKTEYLRSDSLASGITGSIKMRNQIGHLNDNWSHFILSLRNVNLSRFNRFYDYLLDMNS